MQRTTLLPHAAALALTAACSDTARSPVALGVPSFAPTGTNGSPHFVKSGMTGTKAGSDLIVQFKEAGLQEGTTETIQATAQAEAVYQCINGGGKNPSAGNKHTVNSEVSGETNVPVTSGGNISGSITLKAPGAGGFTCPSGQNLTLISVTYSAVEVNDLGPSGSQQTLQATFSFGDKTF